MRQFIHDTLVPIVWLLAAMVILGFAAYFASGGR